MKRKSSAQSERSSYVYLPIDDYSDIKFENCKFAVDYQQKSRVS